LIAIKVEKIDIAIPLDDLHAKMSDCLVYSCRCHLLDCWMPCGNGGNLKHGGRIASKK
jgi:hypothetical protein